MCVCVLCKGKHGDKHGRKHTQVANTDDWQHGREEGCAGVGKEKWAEFMI